MSVVKLQLVVEDNGSLKTFDVATGKIKGMADAAKEATKSTESYSAGLLEMGANLSKLAGGAAGVAKIVDEVNSLGVASLRAANALNAMTNGHADAYLTSMRNATKGLVTDMDLATQATKALGLRVIDTADQAGQLAKYGAILGTNFLGNAGKGVETLTLALSRVGLVQLLDNIGLSGENVRKRFNELKDAGMGVQEAWTSAVFQDAAINVGKLEGALTSTGTALERNKVRWDNWSTSVAENVAKTIDVIFQVPEAINAIGAANNKAIVDFQGKLHLPGEADYGQYLQDASMHGKGTLVDRNDDNAILAAQARAMQAMYNTDAYDPNKRVSGVKAGDDYMYEVITHKMGSASEQQMAAAQKQQEAAEKQIAASEAAEKRASGTKGAFGLDQAGIYSEMFGGANWGDAMSAFSERMKKQIGTGEFWMPGKLPSQAGAESFDAKQKADYEAFMAGNKAKPTWWDSVVGNDPSGDAQKAFIEKMKQDRANQTAGKWGGDIYSKKDYEADMAQYQREMAAAQDAYALATGGATKESLMFRDAQASLNAAFAAGKMEPMEYAKALIQYANAAKDGYASMDNLRNLMIQQNVTTAYRDKNDKFDVSAAAESHLRDAGLWDVNKGDATGHTADDPFAAMNTSASTAVQNIGLVQTKMAETATAAQTHGSTMAQGMGLLAPKVSEANNLLSQMPPKLGGAGTMAVVAGLAISGGMSPAEKTIGATATKAGALVDQLNKLKSFDGMTVNVNVNTNGGGQIDQ